MPKAKKQTVTLNLTKRELPKELQRKLEKLSIKQGNPDKYTFTAQQIKQYRQLKKLDPKITKSDFLKLYYDVRKANAKSKRLRKSFGTLYNPYYSTSLSWMKSKADIKRLEASLKKTLSRGYQQIINEEIRQRLKDNIEAILPDEEAESINARFDDMTDEELRWFFTENGDIERLMYESDTSKFGTFLREATESINARIDAAKLD